MKIDTQLVHAGEPRPRIEGAISMPIFQSSTFEPGENAGYHDLGYIRLSTTPNHTALHHKLAALESTESALVTSSGMAAISATLLTLLRCGDHILVQKCLYGGTFDLITRDLPNYGIEFDFLDDDNPENWRDLLREKTRLIYVETMTNPLLEVTNLEGVVRFARENDLIPVIDNTFASPVNFQPLQAGFDLAIQSATKYLNGHSDIVAGVVTGREKLVTRIKHRLDHLGGALDPHACFLLHRGLKTLALRIRAQNDNAMALARSLESHPGVVRVNYPGLQSHPDHQRAAQLFQGFGGVLSFEPKAGADAAEQMLNRLEFPANAPSLGGVETLVTRPAASSHAGMTPSERRRLGISDALIRVSVGIEAEHDLIEDFTSALETL
jgi:cystathionine beta-lyase/cystathionine gamma-synthase